MAIRVNFSHVLSHLGRIGVDLTGLVADGQEITQDPEIKAELANCPATSALIADLSQKLRDLQNAVS